jgi:hypothetical protein
VVIFKAAFLSTLLAINIYSVNLRAEESDIDTYIDTDTEMYAGSDLDLGLDPMSPAVNGVKAIYIFGEVHTSLECHKRETSLAKLGLNKKLHVALEGIAYANAFDMKASLQQSFKLTPVSGQLLYGYEDKFSNDFVGLTLDYLQEKKFPDDKRKNALGRLNFITYFLTSKEMAESLNSLYKNDAEVKSIIEETSRTGVLHDISVKGYLPNSEEIYFKLLNSMGSSSFLTEQMPIAMLDQSLYLKLLEKVINYCVKNYLKNNTYYNFNNIFNSFDLSYYSNQYTGKKNPFLEKYGLEWRNELMLRNLKKIIKGAQNSSVTSLAIEVGMLHLDFLQNGLKKSFPDIAIKTTKECSDNLGLF